MSSRRLAVWLLATAGVPAGHVIGYGLAHPSADDRAAALGSEHEYLSAATSIAVPVGLAVALAWAVRIAREMAVVTRSDWVRIASAQVLLFTLQEVGERLAGGHGLGAMVESAVGIGLVAQIVVAFVVVRVVALVGRSIGAMTRARAPLYRSIDSDRWLTTPQSAISCGIRTVAVGLRAPPPVSPTC